MVTMDYKKIHDNLIERGKNRKLDGYVEKHHIIPKCMNGTNEPNNLVKLTAREHFLVHWLLHEMYPENSDLRYAFWSMCRNSDNQQRYKPSYTLIPLASSGYYDISQNDLVNLADLETEAKKNINLPVLNDTRAMSNLANFKITL